MKRLSRVAFVALLLGSLTASSAVAREFGGRGFGHPTPFPHHFHHFHRFHHGGGPFFFGFGVGALVTAPFWYPPDYGYPAYAYPYYAPPAAVPPPPVYWYYCQNPPGYYPYVPACPGGWVPVVPPASAQ